MINPSTYKAEWLTDTSRALGKKVDPKILEKVVRAFTLLEQLRVNNIDLIFKGGTCLLLMINPPRRFSIDIDIITEVSITDIETVLDKIVEGGFFTRWKSDNKRKHVIDAPIAHYKLYYQSQIDQHYGEEPILLDILFSANPYPATKEVSIDHPWLQTEDKHVAVEIPVPEAILGDKLTAFAPNTTGILYSKGRHTEIIKQLFDIGNLFDVIEDTETVNASYRKIVQEEIHFRKLEISAEDVLDDTFQTCLILARRDSKNQEFKHLSTGIRNIINFILGRFNIEEAIIAGAKAAYLTQILKSKSFSHIQRYSSPTQIKDWTIENPDFNKLNKLKKSNPGAFFYWYCAIQLA